MNGLNFPDSALKRRLTSGLEDDFQSRKAATRELAVSQFNWRVWDAIQTAIGAAGNDDLGITTGTFGTASPVITAGDVKAANVTRYARQIIRLPDDYVAGTDLTLRFLAGMVTTVSDGTATLDVSAHRTVGDGTVGADLVTTNAQSINSLTAANKDFVVAGATLLPGDQLDIRIVIAAVDTATGTAVTPTVKAGSVLYTYSAESQWEVGGNASVQDARNGILSLATPATANAEAWARSAVQSFKFHAGKPFVFQAAVQFTDGNVDDMVLAVGVTDQAGAALIQNGGAAIKSGDLDGALFLKFKDETFWRCFSSVDQAQQNTALNATDKNNLTRTLQVASGSGYKVLTIEGFPLADQYQIAFSIDDQLVAKHDAIDISGGTEEMNVVFFAKSGGSHAQTLKVDWVHAFQKR